MKGLLTENLKLSGKKILLRLDLNVPLKDKSITETNRIEKVIPTINFLLKKKIKDNNFITYRKTKRKSKS